MSDIKQAMKLAEQMMTKDSLCEAERLEEGLRIVREVNAALSSAAVAEREPVAVVVGHHVTQGPNVEFLTDNLAVGTKLEALRKEIERLGKDRDGYIDAHINDVATALGWKERADRAEAEVSRLTALPGESRTSQEDIATEMRRLRAVRKLGIRAMAKEIGISPTTLSRVENGAEPDMKTSRSILRYAGACSCCGAAFAEKAGV